MSTSTSPLPQPSTYPLFTKLTTHLTNLLTSHINQSNTHTHISPEVLRNLPGNSVFGKVPGLIQDVELKCKVDIAGIYGEILDVHAAMREIIDEFEDGGGDGNEERKKMNDWLDLFDRVMKTCLSKDVEFEGKAVAVLCLKACVM